MPNHGFSEFNTVISKDCFNHPWPSKTPKVHLRWLLDRFEVLNARLVENHRWRYRPRQPPMGRHFRGRVVGKHAPSLLPSFPIGISFSSGLFAGAMLAGVTQNDGLLVSKVDFFGLKIMAMWGWHLFVRFYLCRKKGGWEGWNPKIFIVLVWKNETIWKLHPRRLTWNLRIHRWKRKIIFQTIIFRFYVNLRGCNMNTNFRQISSTATLTDMNTNIN